MFTFFDIFIQDILIGIVIGIYMVLYLEIMVIKYSGSLRENQVVKFVIYVVD